MWRWIWNILTNPIRWVLRRMVGFILPIGLSVAFACFIDFEVQQHHTSVPPKMEFSVRQTGWNTQRSCLEIYETETFETFERLCRLSTD